MKTVLLFLIATSIMACMNDQDHLPNESSADSTKRVDSVTEKAPTIVDTIEYKPTKTLEVGDRIELYGGYDYDPLYLKNPPASGRIGTVIKFIKSQNKQPSAVVKLKSKITGDSLTGDILVLDLRYEGQTWNTSGPVHIELCNFEPEDKPWKDRRKGEWVEAAASFKFIK